MSTESSTPSPQASAPNRVSLPESFKLAAQAGDVAAVRAAADWYRERDLPPDPHAPDGPESDRARAFYVECLACSMEVQLLQGSHLVRLIDYLAPAFGRSGNAAARSVARIDQDGIHGLLQNYGLPFHEVHVHMPADDARDPNRIPGESHLTYRVHRSYTIDLPPVAVEERERVAGLLVDFVRTLWPRANVRTRFRFRFWFAAHPATVGAVLMGMRQRQEPA